jgi:hypothetical protein
VELNFLEHKKVKKYDRAEDMEVEVLEDEAIPFETHPHELAHSVAVRYANRRYGDLRPPPGTKIFLRKAATGLRLNPNSTVQELRKEGIILVELGTSL